MTTVPAALPADLPRIRTLIDAWRATSSPHARLPEALWRPAAVSHCSSPPDYHKKLRQPKFDVQTTAGPAGDSRPVQSTTAGESGLVIPCPLANRETCDVAPTKVQTDEHNCKHAIAIQQWLGDVIAFLHRRHLAHPDSTRMREFSRPSHAPLMRRVSLYRVYRRLINEPPHTRKEQR